MCNKRVSAKKAIFIWYIISNMYFVIIGIALSCTNLRVFIKVMADPGDQLAYGFYNYWLIILVFVKAIEFFFRS